MFDRFNGMSFKLRFIGSFLKLMGFLFQPYFFIRSLFYRTRPLPRLRFPELLNESATSLAKKIRNREITSEKIVRAYILRCRDVNVYLNAIVEDRYVDAIREAHDVDQRLLLGDKTIEQLEKETPLLGVPITIKECLGVKGLSYTGGTLKLKGRKAEEDAEVVKLLRAAGAIPICVTNTPELCTSWESYNMLHGRTLNPYDFSRTPGGSSGGEAALISSGASVIGIGSDIGGSIRVPALFSGIFGHKPTTGLVSLKGHFPKLNDAALQSFLVVGPITRYAEDLTLLLKIMVEPKNLEILNLDTEVSVPDVKIYYKEDFGSSQSMCAVHKDMKVAMKRAIDFLSSYCTFSEEMNLPELAICPEGIMGVTFGSIKNLQSLYQLGDPEIKVEPNTKLEMFKSFFGASNYTWQCLLFQFFMEETGLIAANEVNKYNVIGSSIKDKLINILGTNGVFLFPSFPVPALKHGEIAFTISGVLFSMFCNVFGLPATQVPLGLSDSGLPVGIQVIAAPNQDRLCLAVAKKLEEVFNGWTPPDFTGPLTEERD